jgi:hypothetical protein
MYYAQFYQNDLLGQRSQALGDRGVLIMDGRCKSNFDEWATQHCKRYKYLGYSVHQGISFTQSRQITHFKEVKLDS